MVAPVLDAALERLVGLCEGDLGQARQAMHARSGAFDVGDAWYEERIRFFFDWYLCEYEARPLRNARGLDQNDQALALACTHAARGLYACEIEDGIVRLCDWIGGAVFRLGESSRLRAGDVCDGFLVHYQDRVQLLPGAIFHPAQVHGPLADVAARARQENLPRAEVLDGLLRMRMRFDRFESIRPQHIYRFEALADRDILSAAWARPSSR